MVALFTGLAAPSSFLILAFFFVGAGEVDGLLFLEADAPVTPMRCCRFRSVTRVKSFSAFLCDKIP